MLIACCCQFEFMSDVFKTSASIDTRFARLNEDTKVAFESSAPHITIKAPCMPRHCGTPLPPTLRRTNHAVAMYA